MCTISTVRLKIIKKRKKRPQEKRTGNTQTVNSTFPPPPSFLSCVGCEAFSISGKSPTSDGRNLAGRTSSFKVSQEPPLFCVFFPSSLFFFVESQIFGTEMYWVNNLGIELEASRTDFIGKPKENNLGFY